LCTPLAKMYEIAKQILGPHSASRILSEREGRGPRRGRALRGCSRDQLMAWGDQLGAGKGGEQSSRKGRGSRGRQSPPALEAVQGRRAAGRGPSNRGVGTARVQDRRGWKRGQGLAGREVKFDQSGPNSSRREATARIPWGYGVRVRVNGLWPSDRAPYLYIGRSPERRHRAAAHARSAPGRPRRRLNLARRNDITGPGVVRRAQRAPHFGRGRPGRDPCRASGVFEVARRSSSRVVEMRGPSRTRDTREDHRRSGPSSTFRRARAAPRPRSGFEWAHGFARPRARGARGPSRGGPAAGHERLYEGRRVGAGWARWIEDRRPGLSRIRAGRPPAGAGRGGAPPHWREVPDGGRPARSWSARIEWVSVPVFRTEWAGPEPFRSLRWTWRRCSKGATEPGEGFSIAHSEDRASCNGRSYGPGKVLIPRPTGAARPSDRRARRRGSTRRHIEMGGGPSEGRDGGVNGRLGRPSGRAAPHWRHRLGGERAGAGWRRRVMLLHPRADPTGFPMLGADARGAVTGRGERRRLVPAGATQEEPRAGCTAGASLIEGSLRGGAVKRAAAQARVRAPGGRAGSRGPPGETPSGAAAARGPRPEDSHLFRGES